MLNARDAEARGARILTRTKVVSAERAARSVAGHGRTDGGAREVIAARAIVNAGGPWVEEVVRGTLRLNSSEGVRLVRGSHIVTKKLYDHDKCYFFQGEDGRIIFAIPYEQDFTLIGTTDQDHKGRRGEPVCTPEEQDYLCAFASRYFAKPVTRDDIVWTYSGVRPLYDDGAKSATAATRDYVLSVDADRRAAAERVRRQDHHLSPAGGIARWKSWRRSFRGLTGPWTAGVALPGGDFPVDGVAALTAGLTRDYPFLDAYWAGRLIRAYGTEARAVLGTARDGRRSGPRLRRHPDRGRSALADGAANMPARARRRGLAAHQAGPAADGRADRARSRPSWRREQNRAAAE